ncbi:type VI secretion system ImpA family N-terminal domain-containing protein [Vibrio hepatarius]|uniref:type VI secretion system ImpA family N-terminal domain-containing protein n=1 Tax=Vibrio hepatarius TaxID=171383 RepID=UPI001C0A228E|nr:type VI secretion system ImpA family N-terminal domain-containing protein [Vibrio hepatarius]MBU2896149.1 type VI secretion system ImpA family N-terminal domain-containing protein [Vibrio hepatarius]
MYFSDFARRPISEQTPCGVNPNNLEDFEEIKRQINNINKVTGRVSWKKVQQLSKAILKNQSKDLRCGCYYAVASAHNDGLIGFVDALNAILDLCVVYWSSSYPEVSKSSARIGAFEWLAEHGEKRVKQFNITLEDKAVLEAGHRVCLRIEEELRLYYGHKAPSLGGVRRTLSQFIDELKDAEDKKEQAKKKSQKQIEKSQAINNSVPPITVKINPSTAQTLPHHDAEPKSNRSAVWTIAVAVGVFIFALSAFYLKKDQLLTEYKQKIASNNISVLLQVTQGLNTEKQDTIEQLKQPLISAIDKMVFDLEHSPKKVSQLSNLIEITDNLANLYSDSSSVQVLSTELNRFESQMEQDFKDISNRFSRARTAIANLKLGNNDTNTQLAYQYSNSLFPLLGRIEYAEKANDPTELDRSLVLINIYIHKIAQLKAAQIQTSLDKVVAE